MTALDWTAYYRNGPRIPYLDNCPTCSAGKLNAPIGAVRPDGADENGVRADYVCWHCGHRWTTAWLRED